MNVTDLAMAGELGEVLHTLRTAVVPKESMSKLRHSSGCSEIAAADDRWTVLDTELSPDKTRIS